MDCDVNGNEHGCSGGTLEGSYNFIIRNRGITSATNYPYTATAGTCQTSEAVATIKGYEYVPENSELSLMKAAANQPMSVVIDAGGWDFTFYSGGLFTGPCGTDY
ncbi:Vignain [Dendrobium catenatum]|uniref:Vignain n=1 Tax=Dendrobium catenatum TaxID=906689 RepID=A0A2I0X798_9ASPA|nr:Vignain [Dendrobium catenatum]